jgi:hypothetical protein
LALCGLTLLAVVSIARADEVEALRSENARLRERVEALEKENASLRGVARDAPPPLPTRIVEKRTPEGTLDATEPRRVAVTGGSRKVHLLWIERRPGADDATLWVRAEFSGGIYRYAKTMDLMMDGGVRSLPIATYDSTPITTGMAHRPVQRDHEELSVPLDSSVLAMLGRTATLTGKVRRTSFVVPAEALASIRALARRP